MIEGLVDDALLTASWTDINGDTVQSDIMQTSGVNMTATLDFYPLFSSHGGRYVCNASITIPATSTVKSNSEPYDVIIHSNYCITYTYS